MAKPIQNPVLPEHAELFDIYIRKWQHILNLNDWRIVKGRGHSKELADVTCYPEHRLAKYRLGKSFGSAEVSNEALESTALHELLHVLLAPLLAQAYADQEHTEAVAGQEHSVIGLLEKLLMKLAEYASEKEQH